MTINAYFCELKGAHSYLAPAIFLTPPPPKVMNMHLAMCFYYMQRSSYSKGVGGNCIEHKPRFASLFPLDLILTLWCMEMKCDLFICWKIPGVQKRGPKFKEAINTWRAKYSHSVLYEPCSLLAGWEAQIKVLIILSCSGCKMPPPATAFRWFQILQNRALVYHQAQMQTATTN